MVASLSKRASGNGYIYLHRYSASALFILFGHIQNKFCHKDEEIGPLTPSALQ